MASAARSEPAPGSLKSWHQTSSPSHSGRRKRALLLVGAVAPGSSARPCPGRCRSGAGRCRGRPRPPAGRRPRPGGRGAAPRPPSPSGKCTHASPASHRARRKSRRSGGGRVVRREQRVDPRAEVGLRAGSRRAPGCGGGSRPWPARSCAPRRGRRRSAACGCRRTSCGQREVLADSPPAPCTWIALSRIHSTVCGVAILIAWISVCAPWLPTVSISQAVLSTSSRSCSIRTRDSAIQSRTTPCSASGLPKATRSTRAPAHQLDGALGHADRAACSGGSGPGRAGPARWRSRRPPRRSGWSPAPGRPSKRDLGVAAVVVVVVAEDLHAAHDRRRRGCRAGRGSSTAAGAGRPSGSVLPITMKISHSGFIAPVIHHLRPLMT